MKNTGISYKIHAKRTMFEEDAVEISRCILPACCAPRSSGWIRSYGGKWREYGRKRSGTLSKEADGIQARNEKDTWNIFFQIGNVRSIVICVFSRSVPRAYRAPQDHEDVSQEVLVCHVCRRRVASFRNKLQYLLVFCFPDVTRKCFSTPFRPWA